MIRKLIYSLLCCLLMNLTITGFILQTEAAESDQLRIPYTYEESLYVITNTGKTVLRLPAQRSKQQDWKGQGKLEYGFSVPDLHPDQNRLVCVHCHNYDPSAFPHGGYCELVEISFEKKIPPRVIWSPGTNLDAPVWSPDGKRIAFLLGRNNAVFAKKDEIVILEAESGTVIQHVSVPEMRGVITGSDYLRWSADGKKIFIWADRSREEKQTTAEFAKDVGIWNLNEGKVRWLGQWVEDSLYKFKK